MKSSPNAIEGAGALDDAVGPAPAAPATPAAPASHAGLPPVPTSAEIRAMLPEEPRWKYILRKIDVPVQIGRLAILALLWWLWWSDTAWNGWEAFSVFGVQPFPNVAPTFRAAPYETWEFMREVLQERLFWEDAWVTLKEALVGFAIASLLGVTAGLALGRFARVSKIFGPFIIFFNAMPKIAFLPLILVVYGVGEMSKVVLIVMIAFFIVQVPTMAAVRLVDPDLDMVAETMGASTFQRFMKVTLPAIMPSILGALRLAAIISIQGAVFGEIFAAKRGVGQRLITAANQLNYEELFAYVIVLAALSLMLNGIIGAIERRALRWQASSGSAGNSGVSL